MLRRTDACKISRKDSAATQLSHVSGLTSQSSEGSGVNVWDCSYLTSAATYSSVTRTPVRSEPKFPAKAKRLQGGEFDASLRGLAKNQSGASVSEMLSYGSFADVIGKIEEQKSKDFPATALNVLSLFSEGEASGAAGPSGALQPTSEARELKDKLLNMAKAKTAKLFELLTPPSTSSSESIAKIFTQTVTAKAELKKNTTGVIFVNPKMWTESKTRAYATFAPSLD